ncbi:hypothetical protein SASPL_142091 [Salvia splendens]|uniref:TF-B3 domain-containing protein n=1 Tax=Salvia splendens TaxID=180675 RepID=A0A8X8Z959_SALSN|nr:hypothetical protein SASPL_142091 [Salvia splendens]
MNLQCRVVYSLIDMASQHTEGSEDDGSPEGNRLLGSKDLGSNRNAKSDRSRRIWSAREEEILMATLKELAANGWKSDNGFRNGYLVRAREAIKSEFPKTDIMPHPHIYSKITTWKRNYESLKTMLSYSGIGFNSDGTYRIECDDEQWALFCKRDRHAKYMRNKSWPQYEDWNEVFGNDRADGEKRIDVGAAARTIYGNKDEAPVSDEPQAADETSTHMSLQDLFPDMVFPEGVMPEMIDESQSATEVGGPGVGADVGSMRGKQVFKKVLKKQKVEDKMDGVITLMGQIHTDTNERLKEISTRIGYEFDLSNKRSEVFDQLKGIPGLSLKLQFYISKKLVKEPELLDLFRGLPETARAAFVFDLLEADDKLAMEFLRMPSFIKTFSEATSMNELRIPPEFVALHGANLPFDCRLITLLGRKSFPVRVLNIASGCHFYAGWSDFRITNEIVHHDVLTFTMVDAGVFLVKRYNPRTGCPPLGDLQATGYGDSDHSDAPDVDTSDDYVPTQSEGGDSSDGDDYAVEAGVLDEDGCPTFTVTFDSSNINRTLEIPMSFWRRHIRMISLQDPIYFNVNGDSWYIMLDHNETKIWVKRGWRRFKERNNIVIGVRCHFKLIDRNEVQFYVWFDRP